MQAAATGGKEEMIVMIVVMTGEAEVIEEAEVTGEGEVVETEEINLRISPDSYRDADLLIKKCSHYQMN